MWSGNNTDHFASLYSGIMAQALEEIPKLSDNNFSDWKRKAVRACNIYINQCHEASLKQSMLTNVLRCIGFSTGKSYQECSLQSFKTELEKSESIDKCYSTILEYSDSSAGGDRSEQNSSVKQIFDKLSQSVVKDKSPASVLFAGSTTSAGRGGTVAPLSGTMESGHDVCRNTSSSTTGGNTITESNAGFQNDSGKEADEQSGEISWSGNRVNLKGSYEACVDVGARKREQQDRLITPYIVESGLLKGHIFAASFDGHGEAGCDVASQVAAHFSKGAMSGVTGGIGSDTRLRDTFFKALGESTELSCKAGWERAGATMSLLQITPEGKLHTYTLGDARTMLFQNGECKFSTIDMSVDDGRKACDIVKAMRWKPADVLNQSNEMKRQITSHKTRHKYFTDKYGVLSADRLAGIYACHYQKFNKFKQAGQPVYYAGDSYGYRVDGLAVSSGWGSWEIFGGVQDSCSPLVQTFDLKKLDAGAPLQILIGSGSVMYPFNADQMANYLKVDKENNLKGRLVKLVSDAKNGTESKKTKNADNISLTLMELKMSMSDK